MLASLARFLHLRKHTPRHARRPNRLHQFVALMMIATTLVTLPLLSQQQANATMSTDGLMVYSEQGFHEQLGYDYTDSTNTLSNLSSTAPAPGFNKSFVVRTSPIKQEAIAGRFDDNNHLVVTCFDGTTWQQDWSATTNMADTNRTFDVAYETATGDAMVLYASGLNGAGPLAYRTKPGNTGCGQASWSAPQYVNVTNTTGYANWVKLAWDRRASSNLITAVWADSNADLSAMQWNGAKWTNEPGAALETSLGYISTAQDVEDFDVQYESSSGDVMVVWNNSAGGAGTNGVRYSTCTGGTASCTWSSAQTPPTFTDDATNLSLAANPTNDEMVFASLGRGRNYLQTGYWSGSAWTNTAGVDTSTDTPAAGTQLVSTAWLTNGGTSRSVIVYADASATNIGWVVGNGSTFTVQSDASPSPGFSSAQKHYDLQTSPLLPDRLIFMADDTSSNLLIKRLVMTSTPTFTWTDANGGAVADSSLQSSTLQDFSFAYWRIAPLTQNAYRWYQNTNALQPTTSYAAQNTAANINTAPSAIRLRMNASLPFSSMAASTKQLSLQYATSTSGPWLNVGTQSWWNSSWLSRKKVTFNNLGSRTDLADFTVLVSLNSSNVDYSKTQNSGQDIRFVDADGTSLPYEIEEWDENGTSTVWVKVPQIDANSNTDYVWMYYNNGSASDAQSASSTFDSKTSMVQHLEETASCSTTFSDSTSNANSGSCNNSPSTTTGQIGGARSFNGSNDSIIVSDSSSLSPTNQVTVSAWVNQSALSTQKGIVGDWSYGTTNGPYAFQTGASAGALRFFVSSGPGDTGDNYADSVANAFSSGWHQVAVVYDGTQGTSGDRVTFYVDGSPVGKQTITGGFPTSMQNTNSDIRIGDFYGLNRYWNGSIDEVQIDKTSRSAEWLAARYLSQSNQFNTFGSEESQSSKAAWAFYDNSTPSDGATVSSNLLSDSTVSESYTESSTTALNPNALATNAVGEWDFSLDGSSAAGNTTYYFRMATASGIALVSYTRYPMLTFSSTMTQSAYRWYQNADSTTPGAAIAAENTAGTVASVGTPVRLRTQLGVSGADLSAQTQAYSLQYSTSTGGPWTNVDDGWWNSSWLARRKITFDNTSSSTDLQNISVLVSLTSSNINYAKTQNSGQDIRFVDGDGAALPYEIEKWDESGTSSVWVKVPQIDRNSNLDHIWMYYDNGGASDGQSPTSTFDSSTKMMLHLNESGACVISFYDSTSNDNDGTCSGTPTAVTGKIAGGRQFDGNADQIRITHSASINPTSAMTVSGWFQQTNLGAGQAMVSKWNYDGGGGTSDGPFALQTGATSDRLRVFIATANNDAGDTYADTPVGSWTTGMHHVAFTFDGTGSSSSDKLKVYIDGVQQSLTFYGAGIPSSLVYNTSTTLWIGGFEGLVRDWDGKADQVELDNVARSADWIRTQYQNQNGGFTSYGSEQTAAGTWRYYSNATAAHGATLGSTLLTGSDVAEMYQETLPTAMNNGIPAGQEGEWDFALDPTAASTNTAYYFRMVRSDGTALDAYTYYPTLTIGPTLGLGAYRFYNNNDSTDVGTALAAQDTAASAPAQGTPFRLRALAHVTNQNFIVGNPSIKLQYAARSGTCDTGFAGETYSDVSTGSGAIRFYNNTTPSDGDTVTSNASDPTSGNTKVMQTYEEANNATTVTQIPTGQDGEWDFSLVDYSAAPSSTYCFRLVRSDNNTLDSYTVIPQITTASNQAPNAPSSLAQYKSDGTTSISTGGYTNETSVVLKGTVSDPDSDNTSLCVEVASTLTSPASPSTCGTAVTSGTTASATASSLTSGTTYKWQTKSKDASATYSSSYTQFNSGNNSFTVDTAAPTTGSVYDGAAAGIDTGFNNGSLSSLSCNWAGFADAISGVASYDYSIGTSAGGTGVLTWTNVSSGTTSATPTGLTLGTGTVYYCNVRANDTAGNTSSVISSDGQLVAPTLTFGVSSSSLSFDSLTAGNSYTNTQSLTVATSTNAYGGYSIRQYGPALASGGNNIASFSGGTYASPDAWQSGDTGFGYTSSDTSVSGSNKFQAATCPGGSTLAAPGCYAPVASAATGDIVADHASGVTGTTVSNEQFTLTYRITVPSTQAAGNYNTALVLTCVPSY